MRNVVTKLVVFFSTICVSKLDAAGLPRQCFIVTEMHGSDIDREDRTMELLSDLPILTAMYKTGM